MPPTRMNQQIFKVKNKAAKGGYKLLKKKAKIAAANEKKEELERKRQDQLL